MTLELGAADALRRLLGQLAALEPVAAKATVPIERLQAFLDSGGSLQAGEAHRVTIAANQEIRKQSQPAPAQVTQARSPKTTTPQPCACGRSAYGKQQECGRCLKRAGWRSCSACSRLFPPENIRRRCDKCQASDRRSGARSRSVRTISGGLPSLGKSR